MLGNLKQRWRHVRSDPPGQRFRKYYERRAKDRGSPFVRIAWSLVALMLILAGIVAIPLPGPGFIVIGVGLALLAGESLMIAKLCDQAELAIRRLLPARRKLSTKRGR